MSTSLFGRPPTGWRSTEERRRHGRVTEEAMVRSIHDVLLRGGDAAWVVNGWDITSVQAKTGEQR
jgi:hypothetical protein